MKSSPIKLLVTFAFSAIAFQSLCVQLTDAQEKMFGNGRFLKRVFGDILPQSSPPKPSPSLKAIPKPGQQPTLAKRPSQAARPTSANQTARPRSTAPRSIQPARSADNLATTNRLPKSTGADSQAKIPTRSSAKATLGFGMMVRARAEQLYVDQLDPKGNAATAGVRRGDQLISGGGVDFESVADFNGIAEVLEDGDQLEFAVKRKGTKKEMLIAFGKVPADQTGELLEGTVETDNATAQRGKMRAPAVNQINTQPNSSFMPNRQNVRSTGNRSFSNSNQQTTGRSGTTQTIRSQQEEIQRLRSQLEQMQRQGSGSPAPTLRVPPSAESVMN